MFMGGGATLQFSMIPYLNEVFYRRIETLGISATMKFYHSEGRKQLSLF